MNQTKTKHICYQEAPFFEIRKTLQSARPYEAHAHPTLSIGYMLEGQTHFVLNEGSFLLEHGALAIIPPYTQHACNPLPNTSRSYVMVYIDTNFCQRLQAKHFKEAITFLPLKTPLIFHEALYRRFRAIIEVLLRGYEKVYVEELEAWLEEFLWLYTDVYHLLQHPSSMQDVASFLEKRLDEPMPLNTLATRFGYNPFVLLRHFKHAYGCTPKHYWHDMRIHHAKKLLQAQTPLSLCAQYCGFVDQSHFHRFFKRRTALTPKEYQVNFIQ